jgi:PAS domain S-box-containing protein
VGVLVGRDPALNERLLRRLVAGAPLLVMVVDALGQVNWIDGNVERLTGYRPDELIGTNILDHLDSDWNPAAFESIGAAMARTGLQRPMLYRVRRKDGTAFVAEVTANSQLDDPVVQGLAVYVRQWDERHLLDQVVESLASAAPLRTTLQLLTCVMGAETLDGDGFVMVQPTRRGFAQTISHLPVEPTLVGAAAGADAPWVTAARQAAPNWRRCEDLAEPLRSSALERGYQWCWSWPVVGQEHVEACLVLWRRADEEPDHTCELLLSTLVRVTGLVIEQHGAAERLRHAAEHDPLTGLANRAQFMQRLEDALGIEAVGPLVGVLYVDLDDFKPVNDRLGHGAGDQVLCEIARRLKAAVRRNRRGAAG